MSRMFQLLVGLLCVMVGIVGWGLLRSGLKQRTEVQQYQNSGVTAKATVLRVVRREVRGADSRDKSSFYDQPVVQYRVGDAIYDVQMEQSRADIRFEAGQQVEVVYLADNPSRAKLRADLGSSWLPAAGGGGVMLLASLGILVGTLFSGRARSGRARR